jgi:hypothetical protein
MSPTIVMIISDRVFPSKMTAFGMKHAKDAFEQAQPTGTWSNFATRSILLRYSTSSPLHHRIICTNPIHLFASMFLYFKHLLKNFPVHSRRRSADFCKLANSNSVALYLPICRTQDELELLQILVECFYSLSVRLRRTLPVRPSWSMAVNW